MKFEEVFIIKGGLKALYKKVDKAILKDTPNLEEYKSYVKDKLTTHIQLCKDYVAKVESNLNREGTGFISKVKRLVTNELFDRHLYDICNDLHYDIYEEDDYLKIKQNIENDDRLQFKGIKPILHNIETVGMPIVSRIKDLIRGGEDKKEDLIKQLHDLFPIDKVESDIAKIIKEW